MIEGPGSAPDAQARQFPPRDPAHGIAACYLAQCSTASVPEPTNGRWLVDGLVPPAYFRERQHDEWCRIATLSGGSVHVPQSLVTGLGEAGVTDVAKALRNAVAPAGIRAALAARQQRTEMDGRQTDS